MKFSGRALVVEDNPVNQIVLKAQLQILGFEVDLADNGKVALEKIEPDLYAIIFMDIQMPVMDGIECTENIRASEVECIRRIPIIAVTANVTKQYRDSCNTCGMNGFVTKPLDVPKLIEEIKSCLISKECASGE